MSSRKIRGAGSDFQDHLLEELRDPRFAAEYLMAAFDVDDLSYFKVALGNVAKAHGMQNISMRSDIPRVTLYNILSANSNPSFASIQRILRACDMGINVVARDIDVDGFLERIKSQPMPRTEMVKKIWAYIKKHKLDKEIKRESDRDERTKLSALAKKTHQMVGDRSKSYARKGTKKVAGK